MEYTTSIQIQTPIFLACNNCELWFPAESNHCCTKKIDSTIYSHMIYVTEILQ